MYIYGIFRFCSGKMYFYSKEEKIMGKEHLCNVYPKGKELQAVIHEVKYQILMRLFRKEKPHLENTTSFKDFQDDLNLYEVEISRNLPTLLVSRSAFERALNRAKREGWIYLHRTFEQEGMNPVKKFQIGLTQKGRDVAQKEQDRKLAINNLTPEEINIIKAEIFERILANAYLEETLAGKTLAELQTACDCDAIGRFNSVPQNIFNDVVLRLQKDELIYFDSKENIKEINLNSQHILYAVRCWENQYLKKN